MWLIQSSFAKVILQSSLTLENPSKQLEREEIALHLSDKLQTICRRHSKLKKTVSARLLLTMLDLWITQDTIGGF